MKSDPVNHPSHYCSHPSKVEAITITEHLGFNLGNSFKYLYRAGLKGNPLEDLKKALWYLERERDNREHLWFRWEDRRYDARFDGCQAIALILGTEHRYSGHMTCALERIYVGGHHPRWIACLDEAIERVRIMIRIQYRREVVA